MKKSDFKKKILPELGMLVVFIIAACIYCSPVLEGKQLMAGDSVSGIAAVQESVNYTKTTGNSSWWTGSMFSGMPNYQIGGGKYMSASLLKPFYKLFRWGHHNLLVIVIFYLIAFYILLRAFGVQKWISFAGAFAIAFSSYFFVILAAAHHGKCTSITWMTLVLVGFMLIYKKRYAWGAIFTMFFMAMGLMVHPQMSYYMFMLIGMLFFAELYIHLKEKRYKDLLVATGIFVLALIVGFGTCSAGIFANKEYAEQTMRGGHSELVKESDATNKTKGLDLDYATAWSYGIDETMTFLIPNYMGAASGYNVGKESVLYAELVNNGLPSNYAADFCKSAPTYWGEQPFTSGPVYVGAIVCFLFVLSLFLVKGPYKWALLAATIFSVLLSWGHNFMPLTKLFFDYFPMYNKFRAVSSILIVAEITIPLLGFLALKAIADKSVDKKTIFRSIYISAGITAGICLIFAVFGKLFLSFTSSHDAQFSSQLPEWAYNAIIAQRASMMQADAWRSFIFILLGAGLVYLYAAEKLKTVWFGLALAVLVLADMWPVDKRFFNDSNFVSKREKSNVFAMYPYEKALLEVEKDNPSYRVLNLTTSTFNDARTSYYLKSVGGYSAVKLRRYQDLIDEHLSKMNMNVYNMLNTKYFIVKSRDGNITPQLNPEALGNAWFVDSLIVVNTPNEESDALNVIDTRNTAVLDAQFKEFAEGFVPRHDSTAQIVMTKYTPEYVEYDASSALGGTAVFSEIYYPFGWNAYIDGQPTDHFRVNYVLRALNIPAGNHHIRFEFRPDSIRYGDILSIVCICLMFATMLGYAGYGIYKWRKKAVAK
jgi:hypothetical protein